MITDEELIKALCEGIHRWRYNGYVPEYYQYDCSRTDIPSNLWNPLTSESDATGLLHAIAKKIGICSIHDWPIKVAWSIHPDVGWSVRINTFDGDGYAASPDFCRAVCMAAYGTLNVTE